MNTLTPVTDKSKAKCSTSTVNRELGNGAGHVVDT